jgi:flagellar basal body-associated protein FliL
MIVLSMIGMVVLVAVAVAGAWWMFKNVSFKSEKEDSND